MRKFSLGISDQKTTQYVKPINRRCDVNTNIRNRKGFFINIIIIVSNKYIKNFCRIYNLYKITTIYIYHASTVLLSNLFQILMAIQGAKPPHKFISSYIYKLRTTNYIQHI